MWVIGGPLVSRLLFQSSGEFEVECVWVIGGPLGSRLLFQSSGDF